LARTIVEMAASSRQRKRPRGNAWIRARATRKTGAAGRRRRANSQTWFALCDPI